MRTNYRKKSKTFFGEKQNYDHSFFNFNRNFSFNATAITDISHLNDWAVGLIVSDNVGKMCIDFFDSQILLKKQ